MIFNPKTTNIGRNFMPALMWLSLFVKLGQAFWSPDGCSEKDILTDKEACVLDLDKHYNSTMAFSLMEKIKSMKLLTTLRE